MWMSRVRGFGLLLVLVVLAAMIVASQLIANVGEAKVHAPQSPSQEPSEEHNWTPYPPSEEPSEDHNNWTPQPDSEPPG